MSIKKWSKIKKGRKKRERGREGTEGVGKEKKFLEGA